jgi:hypothetical protein
MELCALLVMHDEATVPVPTQLQYCPADPYAVRATFRLSGGRTVEWFLARELLTEGLRRPAGLGDVRVQPVPRHGRHMVRLVLMTPAGRAELMLAGPIVAYFLERTEAVVPPGTERDHLDLEAQLSQLLAGH